MNTEAGKGQAPDFAYESAFWARGLLHVAGVDEAGRGAWAGPVVVAAVILPSEVRDWPFRDSKSVSGGRREVLAQEVRASALAWSVEFAPAAEVDRYNVLQATRRAAVRALQQLDLPAGALVTDYLHLDVDLPYVAPAKGDRVSLSVAAASLLAKTARDAYMRQLHERFPQYGFAAHKGYGARTHREALDRYGPCPEHRRTFAPVAQARLMPGS
ncbi:ribonuclease HII [Deinococcus peraridilitoris]|uniref:Ribonuclease HII n=1 Tax=Deinococcus peraridilitoris (strain DSM 19664 / LMG 22246 / CIP 109416 / KR-200) TaxID=937777 RepID=K9ZW75_DEIPD|nr:ribonuclease HII [Deinococcus peraridilitoris]AFZ65821.1 ribonuclease HII [Deinococcus peraridilitoris DSM 19664]